MRRVRALFYAINGTGSGHISRQLNIARATRELLHAMGMGADFHLLTSSEAPEQGWDFPTYKLPSKTVVNDADTPNHEFRAHTQFFITNLVATIRPHLLVLDTMPQGSYGEFTGLRPFARQTVFVGRHTNKETSRSPVYRSHIGLYDLVLVPDPVCEQSRYEFPPDVMDRTVFFSTIVLNLMVSDLTSSLTVNDLSSQTATINDVQGKRIATVSGTTSETLTRSFGGNISLVASLEEALRSLEKGKVDAVVYDAPSLRQFAKRSGGVYVVLRGTLNHEYYAVAMPTTTPMKTSIDRAILKIYEDGRGTTIVNRWFGP